MNYIVRYDLTFVRYDLTFQVTLLLNPLMNKRWYADLMTFLIALAMGTMFCVTVFQLIPEGTRSV